MNSLQDAVGWLDDGSPTCRIPRLRKREGRCYELALRGCLKASEWELVHGECIDKFGNRIGHAWLEFDGEAYCPVLDNCMASVFFYKKLQATTITRYSMIEALIMHLHHQHAGPWHDEA